MNDEPVSFTDWLTDSLPVQEMPDKKYRHRRLDENAALRQRILPRLKQVVFEAHEDARRHIRDIEGVSLNPVEISEGQDAAAGYPGQTVHTNNLMGYFGEVLTSIICEEFAPFGDARWEVRDYSPQEKPKASKWITALQKLRFEEQRVPGYQRFDLICCIYGTIRRQGQTWIPREAHHPAYKGGRFLEAIEIYIRDVKNVVREVYDYQGPADDLE